MLKLTKNLSGVFMAKRLFQMFLFIVASMAIIIILISPMILFNGKNVLSTRKLVARQTISSQRLFISAWRQIQTLYFDASLNHQDWYKWKYKYLSKIKTDEDVNVAINTMLASLDDPHSRFFDTKHFELQESYIRSNEDKELTLIEKLQKTYPQVDIKLYTIAGIVQKTEVVKESTFFPKLKMGDEIISINNYILNGMEINSAIDMIRGTGTYLLKIRLKRNNKILEYTVPRGSTTEIKMSSDVLSGDIVKITAYTLLGRLIPSSFDKIIMKYPNAKGYIIDLRGDIGGQALNGVYLAERILGKNKKIISIKYRNGTIIPIISEMSPIIKPDTPIVILVDKKTASASEILAGSLQKSGRAILVGEKTYGKNAMQQMIPLPNKTCLNITTSYFTFGDDYSREANRLTPDYTIKLKPIDIFNGKDAQLEKAISLIKKKNKK